MKYENLIESQPAELVGKLLNDLKKQKAIEIHFDFDDDDDQWSVVRIHTEDDNEISLRLHAEDKYVLAYGYYDEDDDFVEIKRTLSEDETSTVPKKLQKAMAKVLEDEEGLRLPANILSK
ncbi:hypothetical protein [Pollutibacter soli]|uniref:hypothetical protein n=1 Tax=Pollutibacter soli TaxID=3034157 RepID=UPI00301370B6